MIRTQRISSLVDHCAGRKRKLFNDRCKDLAYVKCGQGIKQQAFSDLKLYIIGSEGPEGDFREELYSLVDQFKLNDRVVFQGQVPNSELCLWYNAADAFCLASRGEGSPNVLTEALACGCPSVATDVGAVREIMESESNLGACVLVDSVDDLVSGLLETLEQLFDREVNAVTFKKYNWDWCARKVFNIYQDLG